jgi:hypothetical protein
MGYRISHYLIALVWLINGLFCKLLHLVPRHEQIVGRILGNEYAPILTMLIGLAEVVMVIWILSGFLRRLNIITQMLVIATMNVIEFLLASDLLLWGRFNALFAFIFVVFIYFHGFVWAKKTTL